MTRDKMTEMLSETICVTKEEAGAALAANGWNLLDAAQRLQRARARAERAQAAQNRRSDREGQIGRAVRALIARFDRRRTEARRDDPSAPAMTTAALVPLMLMPAVYARRCW